jgi:hypothetical protein
VSSWRRTLVISALAVVLVCGTAWASASAHTASAARPFCASSVRGDFDGDGRRDVALVGSAQKDCRAHWTVRVQLASGAATMRVLDRDVLQELESSRLCLVGCTAFEAHDLNRDGRDELEVGDKTPATGDAVVVYRLLHGSLRPLEVRTRTGAYKLMLLSYNGSVTGGAWVVCRDRPRPDRRVIQVSESYATPSNHHVDISEAAYFLRGVVFRHLSARTYRVRSNRIGEPAAVPGRRC